MQPVLATWAAESDVVGCGGAWAAAVGAAVATWRRRAEDGGVLLASGHHGNPNHISAFGPQAAGISGREGGKQPGCEQLNRRNP